MITRLTIWLNLSTNCEQFRILLACAKPILNVSIFSRKFLRGKVSITKFLLVLSKRNLAITLKGIAELYVSLIDIMINLDAVFANHLTNFI